MTAFIRLEQIFCNSDMFHRDMHWVANLSKVIQQVKSGFCSLLSLDLRKKYVKFSSLFRQHNVKLLPAVSSRASLIMILIFTHPYNFKSHFCIDKNFKVGIALIPFSSSTSCDSKKYMKCSRHCRRYFGKHNQEATNIGLKECLANQRKYLQALRRLQLYFSITYL